MDRDRSEPSKPTSDSGSEDRTPGGQKPEAVEDRPMGNMVKPEDYPEDDRATGKADR